MTGTYLGARTPQAGTTSTGWVMRLAAGRNILPLPQLDATGAYSPTDDLSLHLRGLLANAGVEGLLRWRFVNSGRLHLALAPAIAASLGQISRGTPGEDDYQDGPWSANLLGRTSLLATIVLDQADIDLAVFGGVARNLAASELEGDEWPYAEFAFEQQGVIAIGGAAIGLAFPASGGQRVSVEWMRYLDRWASPGDAPAHAAADVWTVSFAWSR